MCNGMHVCVQVCAHVCGSEETVGYPAARAQGVPSHPTLVLGTELGSSATAVGALNVKPFLQPWVTFGC